jgi:hypothetical protein
MADVKESLKKSLGYYDWSDVAQCACHIVRKFGIKGSRNILNNIQQILGYINSVREGLETVSGLVNKLQSFAESLFGLDFIKNQIMKNLANIETCPMLDAMIWRELSSVGWITDLAVNKWFADKLDIINKYGTKAHEEIREVEKFLGLLSQMILLVEDCAVELVQGSSGSGSSGVKSLADALEAKDVGGKPRMEELEEYYKNIERVSVVNIDGEIWIAWENSGKVYVRRNVNGVWGSDIYVLDGWYPRLFWDGNRVYLFFMKYSKGEVVIFQKNELGYFGLGFNLWDCIGCSSKDVKVYMGKWKGCSGIKGDFNRQIDGNYASFNYDERGVVPVVNISWGSGKASVVWSDVTITAWNRSYLVYVNDELVSEQTTSSWPTDEVGTGDRIYVKVKIWRKFDGFEDVVVVGCSSNELVYDELKILKKDGFSADSDTGLGGYVSYNVLFNTMPDEYMIGASSTTERNIGYVSYNVLFNTMPDEYMIGASSTTERNIGYVNYFPSQLM